jgi:hypothetical protein
LPRGLPDRRIRIQADGKSHEVNWQSVGCDMHHGIVELEQLSAVSFRLEKLRHFVMLGGAPQMKEYLRLANEKLRETYPKAEPLELKHVTSAAYVADGSGSLSFRR